MQYSNSTCSHQSSTYPLGIECDHLVHTLQIQKPAHNHIHLSPPSKNDTEKHMREYWYSGWIFNDAWDLCMMDTIVGGCLCGGAWRGWCRMTTGATEAAFSTMCTLMPRCSYARVDRDIRNASVLRGAAAHQQHSVSKTPTCHRQPISRPVPQYSD